MTTALVARDELPRLRRDRLQASGFCVLLQLRAAAGPDRTAQASSSLGAELLGISRRTWVRARNRLVEAGWISVADQVPGEATVYDVGPCPAPPRARIDLGLLPDLASSGLDACLVYAYVASFGGEAWAANQTIADDLEIRAQQPLRSVRKAIRRLDDMGLLRQPGGV